MTIRSIKKRIDQRFDKAGQYYLEKFPARLGNYARVVNVPNKPGLVYARLETSGQVVQAVNYLAPAIFDFPVFCSRDKSQPAVLKVSEIRWVYALGSIVNYIAFHHLQHEYPAPDTVWVRRDQILPLLVLPAGGFNVRLFGDIIYTFGMSAPIRVEDADIDLSAYAVSVGAQYVLLEVLADGTLNYVVGDLADSRAILEAGPLPTPTDGAFPICAFEFFGGQTELRRDSTERSIIDLRMFTSNSGDNPASVPILDTSNFDNILSPAEDTIQEALDVLDDHSHAASEITNTPAGSISSTDVQAALNELDSEKAAASHVHDASVVTYTPSTLTDWNSSADPGDTDDALNQLASRTKTLEGAGSGGGHVHGLARWNGASGETTFDLPDVWEYVDSVIINGLEEDPVGYSLSSDGTQIILDTALPDAYTVWANGVIAQV